MYKGNTQVELRRPRKSKFDLTEKKRLTTALGRLTPILIKEAIPSDTFKGSSEILLRLAPLLAPIYDDIRLYVHYFFVPNRLLWSEWETFITGGRLGVGVDPVTEPIPPYYAISDLQGADVAYISKGGLLDYLGCPPIDPEAIYPSSVDGGAIDAMPIAAYQLVWYEYYRDRNYVQDSRLTFPLESGAQTDLEDMLDLKKRDYLKDYFTAALPFTQRGEEVLMPLAGTGSVTYLPTSQVYKTDGSVPSDSNGLLGTGPSPGGTTTFMVDRNAAGSADGTSGRIENIQDVELTASSVSINDLRSAVRLQEWLERNAVGGSRYVESIQAHFGERPQDSRLQRPEFIGGGRINVKISEVVNTAWSVNDADQSVPAANLSGHGVTYGNTNQFRYHCFEHGFIIGIMSIMPEASYHQGLPRMFRRRSFLDYPWPTFAQLGEQPVNKYELVMNPTTMTEDEDGNYPLFGYQSRYADWKQSYNTNRGEFHDTLLFWTLTRNFTGAPTLGESFCNVDQSTADRIFAVPDSENFWCYIYNNVTVVRALPYFGTPTL